MAIFSWVREKCFKDPANLAILSSLLITQIHFDKDIQLQILFVGKVQNIKNKLLS